MKKIFLVCVLVFIYQKQCFSQDKKTFAKQKIYLIYNRWHKEFKDKLLDQHMAGILPLDKDFILLSNNITKYKKDIINIITNKKEADAIKYIALATLQYQCFDIYKKDLKSLIGLFLNKNIGENAIMFAIWQDDFSIEVIKKINSQNDLKMLILYILKEHNFNNSNKELLTQMLTQNFYQQHKTDLKEVGEKPFECD